MSLLDLGRTSVFETSQGNVRVGQRWPNKLAALNLPSGWKNSEPVFRAFNALQVLQSAREHPIFANTLHVPLSFLYDSLPDVVKMDVTVHRPFKWTEDRQYRWTFDWKKDDYDTSALDKSMIPKFKRKPYHFWPIDVERKPKRPPRWALVVLHFDQGDRFNETETSDSFDTLQSFAVIYPDCSDESRQMEDDIAQWIETWLRSTGEFQFSADFERMRPWLPPMNAPNSTSKENWTSGLRVFEMIRIFLDRLAQSYCIAPRVHEHDHFWDAHSGWFNPDAVRTHMIGMAAARVNKAMDFRTRLAIEPMREGALSFRQGDSHRLYRERMAEAEGGEDPGYKFVGFPTGASRAVRDEVVAYVPEQPSDEPVFIDNDDSDENEDGEEDGGEGGKDDDDMEDYGDSDWIDEDDGNAQWVSYDLPAEESSSDDAQEDGDDDDDDKDDEMEGVTTVSS
ncbi:hypothetical protein F5Y16DRAFT_383873 [Xylariaceae sp. FL0255]|nr:hypothetical protein F5Y16DRAFT_383873 [Xylariaceae sp. FL0255]